MQKSKLNASNIKMEFVLNNCVLSPYFLIVTEIGKNINSFKFIKTNHCTSVSWHTCVTAHLCAMTHFLITIFYVMVYLLRYFQLTTSFYNTIISP